MRRVVTGRHRAGALRLGGIRYKTPSQKNKTLMAISTRCAFSHCSGYPLQVRHSPNAHLHHRDFRSYPAALQRWNVVELLLCCVVERAGLIPFLAM